MFSKNNEEGWCSELLVKVDIEKWKWWLCDVDADGSRSRLLSAIINLPSYHGQR